MKTKQGFNLKTDTKILIKQTPKVFNGTRDAGNQSKSQELGISIRVAM
jgi:hypothetical protein